MNGWLRIEHAVSRHPKLLKAGPAASWLWLCGLVYASTTLSDGHIPVASLPYLGIKRAPKLARKLVEVGLWERVEDGFMIHDYLDYNRSAAYRRRIAEENSEHGKLGGRPRKSAPLLPTDVSEKRSEKPEEKRIEEKRTEENTAGCSPLELGIDFQKFQAAYPAAGRMGGALSFDYFRHARESGVTMATLLDAVANHAASAQWLDGKVPNMARWLQEQRWMARLPPPKVALTPGQRWRPAADEAKPS